MVCPKFKNRRVGSSILLMSTMLITKKNYLVFLLLLLMYLPLFKYYIYLNNNGGHSFMTADWLISYRFGYVNRGLFGTFVLNTFNNANSILNFLSYSLVFVYVTIFFYLSSILSLKPQGVVTYALIFSPAFFLFNIYDSQGAFRKEILGILSLFLLINSMRNEDKKRYIFLSSFFYTIGIFSHSVNLFFLTTILLILYKFKNSKSVTDYLLYLIPTSINFIFYFLFSNNEQQLYLKRDLMCAELEMLNLSNLCSYGSFDFLVWDLNAAYLITQNYIINENRQASYFYIVLFLFSTFPLVFDKNTYLNLKYYFFVGVSFIPLFLIAYDWGRWIYIMSVCFFTLYILSEKNIIKSKFKYFLVLYPFLFRIEHCCNPSIDISITKIFENIDYLFMNILSVFQ